ncbi:PilW family protein [Geothrix terrae]|uniref:PilW family protein n=1 Tax=Geothrix terrae TaxID=2922720 RepID=UPI001FAD9C6C|nr:prepilin-type N-terminal cleavage/methylation domain-containing protein [Geothrix terrae]
MSASESSPNVRRSRGFSLIEMLVAVAFLSILMAGMFKVFASSTSAFMAGMETMGVQRNTRWGLNLLQDEILEAGFLFPVRSAPGGLMAGESFQPPLLMQATDYIPTGAPANVPVDELQMVMDVPLDVQGQSSDTIAFGASQFPATIPTGAGVIQAGDMLFIQDAGAEFPTISAKPGSGTNVTIHLQASESAGIDPNTGTPLNTMSPTGGFKFQHAKGMPFSVIRPTQIIRFTVVPRALDPADPNTMVPCLVRQSKPLVPGEIWAPNKNVPTADEQILLENVTGFAVDWSIDGGKTWLRASGAGNEWKDIRGALDAAIKGSPSHFIKQSGGVDNPTLPMWTLYTPILIRIDLTTRSVMRRTEFSADSTAANPKVDYRTRRETILLSPRNCGIGLN